VEGRRMGGRMPGKSVLALVGLLLE
jgi:hypothetical protein